VIRLRKATRDPNQVVYLALIVGVVVFPILAGFISPGDSGNYLLGQAADAGVYVLLAIGLNVVVGFAGLLDLGYAAFFAIGAYTYALLASSQLSSSPIHHAIHLPFWLLLFFAVVVAATAGVILGAPTLRLRGDYLAIVTLGFGEIVPKLFLNLNQWTSGVNGVSALDYPSLPIWITGPWAGASLSIVKGFSFAFNSMAYYWLMAILLLGVVILVRNLQRSRMGRAWGAIREDEVAADAMGINTVTTKLLAFSIGAATSGFAGVFYGSKLSLVSPENFSFVVSVTILVMVVLGGMGNIPGVIVGALAIYYVLFNILTNLPANAKAVANAVGLGFLNQSTAGGWPGLEQEVQRLNFLIFGLILITIMLLRPQGLLPSRVRKEELQKGVQDQPVSDLVETT
jgi:ABC-type branched-subunit amino acid transport system permease subunit